MVIFARPARGVLQTDVVDRTHIVIFRFLLNISVSKKDKNTKFCFKNLHKWRHLHTNFCVNWFIIMDVRGQKIK